MAHPHFLWVNEASQLAWSRFQEELAHCFVTPMQKQRRQPSGLASDRWKNPALHSSHRAPATLFCTQRGNGVYTASVCAWFQAERRPRRAEAS